MQKIYMKKIFILSAAVAGLLLTSCKKEGSVETTTTPGAKTLKKITKTEGGQTTVYTLDYDGAHRLTAIRTANNSELTSFAYDANGNVVRTEETAEGFKNIYSYTYSNGLPANATFKSWQLHPGEPDELIEDDVLTYTVTNNQVSRIHLNMLQASEETDFNLTYTNGNLTKVVSNGGFLSYTANFTYGTKKAAFPKLYKYVLDQAGFSLQFFGGNELLSETIDLPGTAFDVNMAMQYTYDADGNVLTSTDGTATLRFEYQ